MRHRDLDRLGTILLNMDKTKVLYNAECPICSREVSAYARYADARALPLDFESIDTHDLAALGLSHDAAARRLHVIQDDVLLAGVPAFAALWREMPRFAWAGRFVMLPVIRPLVEIVYERVLAPILFGMHKRRQRRAQRA